MKAVLDTNVLVSGIFWSGSPAKILHLWNEGRIDALATESILDEYLRSIHKIAYKMGRKDLYDAWSLVLPSKLSLVVAKKSFKLCRDPKDDQFIDCAIAGRAQYLVSGDNDLLVLRKVMHVQILTPRQLIDQIQ